MGDDTAGTDRLFGSAQLLQYVEAILEFLDVDLVRHLLNQIEDILLTHVRTLRPSVATGKPTAE